MDCEGSSRTGSLEKDHALPHLGLPPHQQAFSVHQLQMAVAPFRSPELPAFGLAQAAGWGQGPEVVAELEDEGGVVWIQTDCHQKGLPISLVQLGAEPLFLSALLLRLLPV